MTYRRILVATDGSEPATAATAEAIEFAEAFGATLHAVYVLEATELPPGISDPGAAVSSESRAGAVLEGVVSEAAERGLDTEVETAVLRGDTAAAILSYVDDEGIDLVVMGTHGRTGIDRMLVGSVAERVVRDSPVPVVTVRNG